MSLFIWFDINSSIALLLNFLLLDVAKSGIICSKPVDKVCGNFTVKAFPPLQDNALYGGLHDDFDQVWHFVHFTQCSVTFVAFCFCKNLYSLLHSSWVKIVVSSSSKSFTLQRERKRDRERERERERERDFFLVCD